MLKEKEGVWQDGAPLGKIAAVHLAAIVDREWATLGPRVTELAWGLLLVSEMAACLVCNVFTRV